MAIDFPNTPSDGQVFYDPTSGIRYVYDATGGIWLARSNSFYSSVETGQVIFDNADVTGGSNGLYFSTSANTLYANSINVATDMRVRGNLYIGTNTVTITDSAIMAQTFYIMDNGSPVAVPTGTTSNAAYGVANAAFGHTNTTLTHSQAVYAAVNSAFGVVNSAYDTANSKVSKSGDTITGTLSIVGDLIVSGNTRQINANTMSVSDPLIYLAANNYASDIVDIGFIANYVNTGGANVHTGLYREHENKEYYLFQGYDKEPINNHIGAMSNNMTLSVLNADIRTSNLNLGGANAITWISSGYGVANAAYGQANTAYSSLSNYLPLAGGTMSGALNIGTSTKITFGNQTRQMIDLWASQYGIGVQSSTTYFRTNSRFSWHRGGSHSDTENDPGSGGTSAMTLDSGSHLTAVGSMRSPIFYDSDDTGYYTNPAGTSTMYQINAGGGTQIVPSPGSGAAWFSTAGYGVSQGDGRTHLGYNTGDNTTYVNYLRGAYTNIEASTRSPIYYDLNNTAYYVDPNLTSNLYRVKVDSLQPYNMGGANLNRFTSNLGQSTNYNVEIGFIDGSTVQAHVSTGSGNVGNCYQWGNSEWIDVDPEKDYEFEFWIRSTGDDQIYMGWHETDGYNGGGNQLTYNPYFHGGGKKNTNGTWVKITALLRSWRTTSPNANSSGTDRYATNNSRASTECGSSDGVMHSTTKSIMIRYGTCYGTVNGSKTYFYLAGVREYDGSTRLAQCLTFPYFNGTTWDGSFNIRSKTSWDSLSGIELTGGSGEFRFSSVGGDCNVRSDGWMISHAYMQTPIFYDLNDSGYYVDPNSTSNLYRLNVNGSSIASSGYTRLVNGMIIQWGSQSLSANARNTYNFPIAFPSGCYGFAATGDWDGNTGWAVCGGGVVSASQYFLFTVTDGGPDQIWWIAMGY